MTKDDHIIELKTELDLINRQILKSHAEHARARAKYGMRAANRFSIVPHGLYLRRQTVEKKLEQLGSKPSSKV